MAELKMDEFVKNVGQKVAEDIKQKYIERAVLDKIRAEIAEFEERIAELPNMADAYTAVRYCLEIIDRYTKGENG